MRLAMLAGFVVLAAAGRAPGQGFTEPDPAAMLGTWRGTVARQQCAAVGTAKIVVEVTRDGSGYRVDLGALIDGLRVETLVPTGGPGVELTRDDLNATWATGKLDRAVLRVALGGGCVATASLKRDSLGVAACDEVVGLRAVATTCRALDGAPPPSADDALASLRVGRKVSATPRRRAEATCRVEAFPLRRALLAAGCVPAPIDPQAGPPIPECDALIATVVRATQCDRVPVDMKQRLGEQIRIVARSAAVAEPAARALLVESCRLTREEIIQTLALVGCRL